MHPWLLNISGRLVQWDAGSGSAGLPAVNQLRVYIFMVFVITSVSVLLSIAIKKLLKEAKNPGTSWGVDVFLNLIAPLISSYWLKLYR
jgi:hypothetical protein